MSDLVPPLLAPTNFTADPAQFLNRELSWPEFNARVLHEAFDGRNPLLERLKFLAIFSANLDEFYMVRVAGLRRLAAAGAVHAPPYGLPAPEQLRDSGKQQAVVGGSPR
jgi:polyphosphate kinase